MGKLENSQLIGGAEGDSEDEVLAEDENTRQLLDMLRRGEISNIGPQSAVAPSSAVEPPEAPDGRPSADESTVTQEPKEAAQRSRPAKVSKFKLALSQHQAPFGQSSSSLGSAIPTPVDVVERSSPKMHPAGNELSSVPTLSYPLSALPTTRTLSGGSLPLPGTKPSSHQMPGMVVDSPSFMPRRSHTDGPESSNVRSSAFQSVILESPSFQHFPDCSPTVLSPSSTVVGTPGPATPVSPVPTPTSSVSRTPMRSGVVERRPPTVPNTRTEDPTRNAQGSKSTQRVSRFKAERP
jgi:hypothetical protein